MSDPFETSMTQDLTSHASLRSRELRFKVEEHEGRIYIDDDDFGWDAMFRVGGDFGDTEQKRVLAQAICDVLNESVNRIPTRDEYLKDRGLNDEY